MTEQEFESMYEKSMLLLDEYIKTQVTDEQIAEVKHQKSHVVMNKNYYKQIAIKGDHIHVCKSCGALESATFTEPSKSQLIENETCFHCNHWYQIANSTDKTRLVINGRTYKDGGNSPNSRKDFLGFGGHKWKIERDGVVFETNNLWSGGTVPNEFRSMLPDNAIFVQD